MKTYRVTLKITDATGNPLVVEARGTGHGFTGGDGDNLNIYNGEGKPPVAIFPAGEFAAIEISEDDPTG